MPTIEKKLRLSVPPAALYRAISAELESWLCWRATLSGRVDGEDELLLDQESRPLRLKVLALDKDERVAWRVLDGPDPAWKDTIVSLLVHRSGAGCALTLAHERFRDDFSPGFLRANQRWDQALRQLKHHLEKDDPFSALG